MASVRHIANRSILCDGQLMFIRRGPSSCLGRTRGAFSDTQIGLPRIRWTTVGLVSRCRETGSMLVHGRTFAECS